MSQAHFSPELLTFLRDLKKNNDRDWFKKNKRRYEDHLKEPAIAFISDMGPLLHRISKHFRADPRPSGGSLFRIYRDTRFSKDKSPYKTHMGIHFRHEQAKDAHAPGFYLHVEPEECFIGCGIWHPDSKALKRIRDHLVADPAAFKRARNNKKLLAVYEPTGDSLKRPPRGYDPDHPLVDELKRKDHIVVASIEAAAVCRDDFPLVLADNFKKAAPYVKWLCEALDVPF